MNMKLKAYLTNTCTEGLNGKLPQDIRTSQTHKRKLLILWGVKSK